MPRQPWHMPRHSCVKPHPCRVTVASADATSADELSDVVAPSLPAEEEIAPMKRRSSLQAEESAPVKRRRASKRD
ncbi:hypothetical protein BDR03DRAFT_966555 [Suillus americanus]|nr:hypothetical protein BDR03DRAFT_966555 [Suillus americanus]